MAVGRKWYVRRCAVGVGIAMGVYLLTLALCAYLTVRGIVAEGQTTRCVWLCALAASFTGTAVGGGKTVRRGMMTLCCAAAFYLAVILLGLLADGSFVVGDALRLLAPIGLGAAGAFVSFREKGRGGRRGRRSRRGRR